MTRQRSSARPASRWTGIGLAAGVLAGAGQAHADALDLFYERTVMTAADARCGLFEPPVAAALAASRVQARGAALRAGSDEAQLAATEARAERKVAGFACGSRDIADAARRVREAYAGYARLSRMTYPGVHADWRADRGSGQAARWRLLQTADFGRDRLMFGLAGREGANALLAVAGFADGRKPYAARLVLRSPELSRGPYLDTRGGAARESLPLSRRLPPPAAQEVYAAEARSRAGRDLAPKEMENAWAFRFPAEAAGALAALDPREAVAVEFLFQGDQVRRAYIEVGDFAAGRAFLRVAAR